MLESEHLRDERRAVVLTDDKFYVCVGEFEIFQEAKTLFAAAEPQSPERRVTISDLFAEQMSLV